jgi:NAD(P)-dependent dehydrogenase (short-subunit alcohol dehydrogenase family)
MTLKDKRVLVIGGGSGIGFVVARGAAREGAKVVIASRDAKKIAEAAKTISATSAANDERDENIVAQFFKDNGAFDHIAFTAGDWEGIVPGALADLDLAKAAERMTTRFWGAVAVAKHGASKLPPGGSYTITNGMLAHRPMKGLPIVTAGA